MRVWSTHVCSSFVDVQDAKRSFSCTSAEFAFISLDAGLRMDGLPASSILVNVSWKHFPESQPRDFLSVTHAKESFRLTHILTIVFLSQLTTCHPTFPTVRKPKARHKNAQSRVGLVVRECVHWPHSCRVNRNIASLMLRSHGLSPQRVRICAWRPLPERLRPRGSVGTWKPKWCNSVLDPDFVHSMMEYCLRYTSYRRVFMYGSRNIFAWNSTFVTCFLLSPIASFFPLHVVFSLLFFFSLFFLLIAMRCLDDLVSFFFCAQHPQL